MTDILREPRNNTRINSFKYDITVLVVVYNADFERIRFTLDSCINQCGVSMQIIIVDDGSADNHETELVDYFKCHEFNNYRLVLNDTNMGTVGNMMSGMMLVEGKYIKDISPGDRLISETVLSKWVDYNEKNCCDWSFSDIINYQRIGEEDIFISCPAHPQNIKPYLNADKKLCRWNYVVGGDICVGAAMLCRTETFKKYLKIVSDIGVVYAEDNMWRIMMFEGAVGKYYPFETILYEYGTGVSTSNDTSWLTKLKNDYDVTDEFMTNKEVFDTFQKKMVTQLKHRRTVIGKVVIKLRSLFLNGNKRMTNVNP